MNLSSFICISSLYAILGVNVDIPIPNTHNNEEYTFITEDLKEYKDFQYITNIHVPYPACEIYSTVFLFICTSPISDTEKIFQGIQSKCQYFISACHEDIPRCMSSPFQEAHFLTVVSQRVNKSNTAYFSFSITVKISDEVTECLVYGSLAHYWLTNANDIVSLNISESSTAHDFQPLSILSIGPPKCHRMSLHFQRNSSYLENVDVTEYYVMENMLYYEIDTEDEEVTNVLLRCHVDHTSDTTLLMVTALSLHSSVTITPNKINSSNIPVTQRDPIVCHDQSDHLSIVPVIDDLDVSGIVATDSDFYLMGCYNGTDINPTSPYPCSNSFIPIAMNSSISFHGAKLSIGPLSMISRLILRSSSSSGFCVTLLLTQSSTTSSLEVLTFAAPSGIIPPLAKLFSLDISCQYSGIRAVPLAYRTHMHQHGQSIKLWVTRRNSWNLLVHDTENSGEIISLTSNVTLHPEDTVSVRCEYDTSLEMEQLAIGPNLSRDDMCNLYLYVGSSQRSQTFFCSNTTKLFPTEQVIDARVDASKIYHEDKAWNLFKVTSNQSVKNVALFDDSSIVMIIQVDDEEKPDLFVKLDLDKDVITHVTNNKTWLKLKGMFATKNHESFLTDIRLQTVFKIKDTQQALFVLKTGKINFCEPSSVVVDANDMIYVGDSLCGGKIIKFTEEGEYITEYGQKGESKSIPGIFHEISDIAFDSYLGVLYVADSSALQIHVMDLNGNFLAVHDLSRYHEIIQLHYCPFDISLYVIVANKLNSELLLVDPLVGSGKSVTINPRIPNMASITCLPNGFLIIGTSSGRLVRLSPNRSDAGSPLLALTDIVPQIHYLYIHPTREGDEDAADQTENVKLRKKILFSICILVLLSGIAIFGYRLLKRKMVSRIRYQRIAREISDDEESVIYDHFKETGNL